MENVAGMSVTMPVQAQIRMKEMGWTDAVDGNTPKFSNKFYMEGYNNGLRDMSDGNKDAIYGGL